MACGWAAAVEQQLTFAASIFAGLSSFGELSMLMILNIMVSTVWMGDHLSEASSYPLGSSPGECKIEMQTFPSGYTIKEESKTFSPKKKRGEERREKSRQEFSETEKQIAINHLPTPAASSASICFSQTTDSRLTVGMPHLTLKLANGRRLWIVSRKA